MNANEMRQLLRELGACAPAREWAKGKDLAEIWDTCDRADWMLWLCGRMVGREGWPGRKAIILVACDCAQLALPYVTQGDDRPSLAIETARKWVFGEATIEEVYTAYNAAADAAAAADADAAADAVAAAAAYVAYAAARAAADADAYAVAAAAAAADAATDAAVRAAADAADAYAVAAAAAATDAAAYARKDMQQKCLSLIRDKLTPQCLLSRAQKQEEKNRSDR